MNINDMVIGKITRLINERKHNIQEFRGILDQDNLGNVYKESVQNALFLEQKLLGDLLDITSYEYTELIPIEFEQIRKEYCN